VIVNVLANKTQMQVSALTNAFLKSKNIHVVAYPAGRLEGVVMVKNRVNNVKTGLSTDQCVTEEEHLKEAVCEKAVSRTKRAALSYDSGKLQGCPQS
jgi:hypothetical protein